MPASARAVSSASKPTGETSPVARRPSTSSRAIEAVDGAGPEAMGGPRAVGTGELQAAHPGAVAEAAPLAKGPHLLGERPIAERHLRAVVEDRELGTQAPVERGERQAADGRRL